MSTKKKQGNLFSFFNKKVNQIQKNSNKLSPKAPNISVGQITPLNSNKVATITPPQRVEANKEPRLRECLADKLVVGCRLSVFWPDDNQYYNAVITEKGNNNISTSSTVHLLYDDGEEEIVDLKTEKFTVLSWPDEKTQAPSTSSKINKKRRIIDEDSEVEPIDSDIESDGSEFIGNNEEDEDEDENEQAWMVTEDEDSAEASNSKKVNKKSYKRLKVTHIKAQKTNVISSNSDESSIEKLKGLSTPPRTDTNIFSKFSSSGRNSNTERTDEQKCVKPQVQAVTPVTPMERITSSTPESAPMWTEGVVNPAGSHLHNHLPFLQPSHIMDSEKRPRSHPDYNPRTLYYSQQQIESISKSKLSPAQKQWWDLKSQYFDTVLLFKTGKFYEMFHMDADVGVETLGFVYMKGVLAHSGFPESAYGYMSSKLVNAGYKVARVEQTETPAMLAARKKKTKGKKPQVVNREVCSVLSQGTRTFCFLDDTRMLSNTEKKGNDIGPLLAIREEINGDNIEYGVAVVHAIRSHVTLGQFADDVLRSRMFTLLATYEPCEILIQANTSKSLNSLLKSMPSLANVRVEQIKENEIFPKSTAVDPAVRKKLERGTSVHPWDPEETVSEMHRRSYFPRASKNHTDRNSHLRWPPVLKACIDGGAKLALSSLGAALFYLQRSLIDEEILTMGNFKAYIPPTSPSVENESKKEELEKITGQAMAEESGISSLSMDEFGQEEKINHMQLDGTTLSNLEILTNQYDGTQNGSLWKKINHTKSPHGSRLLRAWLLRPLFKKHDIDRRTDAVQELVEGGSASLSMTEARSILGKNPCDLERLLSRVHSMGMIPGQKKDEEIPQGLCHPNERAILYEGDKYVKRKVEDFSKLLNGLKNAARVMECFQDVDIRSPLLRKIVKNDNEGGCFPSSLENDLQWFYDNFDIQKATKGLFEPARGVDLEYDEACDEVVQFEQDFQDYKDDVCKNVLRSSQAEKAWKYINTKIDSRDKYLIELPVSIRVPSDFYVKGKRGSGAKQVNKYRTPVTDDLVKSYEASLERKAEGKARGMQIIFAKFDALRAVWQAAAHTTAILDALGSLAQVSSMPGFTRPNIIDCDASSFPSIKVTQGFHPCVEVTHSGGDFIPNDMFLGGSTERVLLLSGPNMGGKSTLLRQTCLISILAQIGAYVPASECSVTPIDRIFTRLGASDRILSGQSTFFVELAETAAALKGATRRSLVIMDELGRGTSTFDGTAIAHATVKHLVESNQCLALFATHYHSLLEDWKGEDCVRLGHMECMVNHVEDDDDDDCHITFLYTLGEGACPKSFGINVARLAALPKEVLTMAKMKSSTFEKEFIKDNERSGKGELDLEEAVRTAIERGDLEEVERLWESIPN